MIYAVVAVLGFFMGNAPLLGIVSNNSADSVLHVVIAVIARSLNARPPRAKASGATGSGERGSMSEVRVEATRAGRKGRRVDA